MSTKFRCPDRGCGHEYSRKCNLRRHMKAKGHGEFNEYGRQVYEDEDSDSTEIMIPQNAAYDAGSNRLVPENPFETPTRVVCQMQPVKNVEPFDESEIDGYPRVLSSHPLPLTPNSQENSSFAHDSAYSMRVAKFYRKNGNGKTNVVMPQDQLLRHEQLMKNKIQKLEDEVLRLQQELYQSRMLRAAQLQYIESIAKGYVAAAFQSPI